MNIIAINKYDQIKYNWVCQLFLIFQKNTHLANFIAQQNTSNMQMLLCKRHEIGEIAVVIKKEIWYCRAHTHSHLYIQGFGCVCITQDIYYDCNNECLQQRGDEWKYLFVLWFATWIHSQIAQHRGHLSCINK